MSLATKPVDPNPDLPPTDEYIVSDPPKRRGRPPLSEDEKERRRIERESQKKIGGPAVTAAVNMLDSGYGLLVNGLMLVGARNAAKQLSDQIPSLQEQNKAFLQADPKLAERIAKVGAATGRAGFILTNLAVLGGVAFTAATELGVNLPQRKPKPTKPQSDSTSSTPAANPLFPGGLPE